MTFHSLSCELILKIAQELLLPNVVNRDASKQIDIRKLDGDVCSGRRGARLGVTDSCVAAHPATSLDCCEITRAVHSVVIEARTLRLTTLLLGLLECEARERHRLRIGVIFSRPASIPPC